LKIKTEDIKIESVNKKSPEKQDVLYNESILEINGTIKLDNFLLTEGAEEFNWQTVVNWANADHTGLNKIAFLNKIHNIDFEEKNAESVDIFDGYKILMEDKHDNLGWRIIAQFSMHPINFRETIRLSHESQGKPFEEHLPKELIRKVKGNLSILNYINKNRDVNSDKLTELLKEVELDQYELLTSYIKSILNSNKAPVGYPEIRKIPVKATTIQSAKGLAADLVFITHFDNQYFIQNRDNKTICDQDICNLLVSITRAKQKLFLISSNHERPTFLDWISNERINSIR